MKSVVLDHPQKPEYYFDGFYAKKNGGEVCLRNGTLCKIAEFMTVEKNDRFFQAVGVVFEEGKSPFDMSESYDGVGFLFHENGIYAGEGEDDESLDLVFKQPLNYSLDLDILTLFEQIELTKR